jgi:hypothetical protein
MKKFALAAASAVLAFCGSAHAVVTGSAYFVTETQANNASPGFTTAGCTGNAASFCGLAATFTTANGPLDFESSVGGYTLQGFLLSNPGTIITSGSATNLGRAIDGTAGPGPNGAYGLILELTGSVSVVNGQMYNVQHDDGVTLRINGVTVVNAPGPTSSVPTPFTWTGLTGTYAFDLIYGECCGSPAVLITNLPLTQRVPEPGTLVLAGLALAGLGASRRRKQ